MKKLSYRRRRQPLKLSILSYLSTTNHRLDRIRRDLLSRNSIPDDILSGLTHTTSYYKWGWDRSPKNRPANLYWIEDVHKAYSEYIQLPVEARKAWLIAKRKEGHRRMEDVAKREIEHENAYWSKTENNEKKREERASSIENLIRKDKNEYGFPRFKMAVVETCTVYSKAMMSSSTHPFTERAWIGFKNKLIAEHDKIVSYQRVQRQAAERLLAFDVAVQNRQMDVVKKCFELLRPEIEIRNIYTNGSNNTQSLPTSSASSSTSQSQSIFESELIKFLPWCTSFQNPPFINNDPTTLWDDEFLMGIYIPQLRIEALHLKNNPNDSTTICDAVLNNGLGNKRIFKCALCQNQQGNREQLYSFFEVRLHLVKSIHNFRVIDDSMIIAVPEAENPENAQLIPRSKPEIFFAVGFNCNLIANL